MRDPIWIEITPKDIQIGNKNPESQKSLVMVLNLAEDQIQLEFFLQELRVLELTWILKFMNKREETITTTPFIFQEPSLNNGYTNLILGLSLTVFLDYLWCENNYLFSPWSDKLVLLPGDTGTPLSTGILSPNRYADVARFWITLQPLLENPYLARLILTVNQFWETMNSLIVSEPEYSPYFTSLWMKILTQSLISKATIPKELLPKKLSKPHYSLSSTSSATFTRWRVGKSDWSSNNSLSKAKIIPISSSLSEYSLLDRSTSSEYSTVSNRSLDRKSESIDHPSEYRRSERDTSDRRSERDTSDRRSERDTSDRRSERDTSDRRSERDTRHESSHIKEEIGRPCDDGVHCDCHDLKIIRETIDQGTRTIVEREKKVCHELDEFRISSLDELESYRESIQKQIESTVAKLDDQVEKIMSDITRHFEMERSRFQKWCEAKLTDKLNDQIRRQSRREASKQYRSTRS